MTLRERPSHEPWWGLPGRRTLPRTSPTLYVSGPARPSAASGPKSRPPWYFFRPAAGGWRALWGPNFLGRAPALVSMRGVAMGNGCQPRPLESWRPSFAKAPTGCSALLAPPSPSGYPAVALWQNRKTRSPATLQGPGRGLEQKWASRRTVKTPHPPLRGPEAL